MTSVDFFRLRIYKLNPSLSVSSRMSWTTGAAQCPACPPGWTTFASFLRMWRHDLHPDLPTFLPLLPSGVRPSALLPLLPSGVRPSTLLPLLPASV